MSHILHISYTTRWGAGKALARHHAALLKAGEDSDILIADRSVPASEHIHQLQALQDAYDSAMPPCTANTAEYAFDHLLAQPWRGCRGSFEIRKHPLFKTADVIELRQMHAGRQPGFFNLRALPAMSQEKPVIWRLSDPWAFTGFCCYPFDCTGWQQDCRNCPLVSTPERTEARVPAGNQAPMRNQRLKRQTYRQSNIHVVSPSLWLLNAARTSVLATAAVSFTHIPVGVDTATFSDRKRSGMRTRLGISDDEVVVVANAPDLKNYRKGGDLLVRILKQAAGSDLSLLIIGQSAPDFPSGAFRSIHATGYIDDDDLLAASYAAGDVFAFPSRQDNSAQVLLEAAACGLPVVCFDVGGNAEYIRHNESGFAITPFDCGCFADQIVGLATNHHQRRAFGEASRSVAERFSQTIQTARFQQLYNDLS